MPRPVLALLVTLGAAAALAGCGGGDDERPPTEAPATAPATTERAALPGGCERVAEPRRRAPERERRPRGELAEGRTWTVRLRTNCGTIGIRLATDRAPRTASSFASLVRRGFYDGLAFHRIVAGFVIQGGDPLGSGIGGPGYTVVERPPSDLRYTRGTVAMAKTEAEPAGASGSQFFIVTARDAGLPPDYALVGTVDGGEDVVERIAAARTSPDERPLSPMVIERATLESSGG